MTVSFPRTSLCSVALGMAVMVAPAYALEPKDGWEALSAFLEGAGFDVSNAGFTTDGDVMVANRVVITDASGSDFRFEIPQLRIEPRDVGLALVPSATLTAVLTDALGVRRQFGFQHDAEFGLDLTESNVVLTPSFDQMTVTLLEATQNGTPVDEAFSMALSGLEGLINLTMEEKIDVQMDLDLERIDYTQRVVSDFGPAMRQDSRGTADDLTLTLSATGFEAFEAETTLAEALQSGFSLNATGRSLRSTSSVVQTGFFDMDLRLAGGDSNFQITLSQEGFTLGMDLFDSTVSYGPEGSGMDATLGRMDVRMEMPLIPTPEDERFGLGMVMERLAPSETTLAMLGLSGFAEDTMDFRMRFGGAGRWLRELETIEESDDAPLDLSAFTLEELFLRIGTATLTGAGEMAFTGGSLMAQESDVPDGDGTFFFDLIGGEALLNRLGDAGLLPADQLFVGRMMMGAVGRSVGTDHLRSELTLRPGQEPLINGMPIPF